MKKFIAIILAALVALSALAACGGGNNTSPSPSGTDTGNGQQDGLIDNVDGEEPRGEAPPTESAEAPPSDSPRVAADREGNPITLPEVIERVMIFGPSNCELLVDLGFGDAIVAADTYSGAIAGLAPDLPLFDMAAPDVESIVALDPDVIFVTGMVQAGGEDPYKPLRDSGICVIYVPSSSSIESIKEDIRFVAAVMGAQEGGAALITKMETEIAAIKAVGDTITEKKTVYFELSAAPYMYSFGSGVFLNEMIEIVGAVNVLADQESWLSVADEAVLGANPDVILTSVNYIDDPIGEIKSRPGWQTISAVAAGDVYYIDADASNRPNHNIVKALREIALAVYPDKYGA
ncbi:MAG: ABC transporter substrate-binding protein [Oscillospiraceae bacterium]|jgi:iron complex transport system substrate-binding protein|nr:ABC transporter substrate-binding protein [Oscillospiraceae bacterium]